jgi:sulfite reductase (ferredoxin)
MAYRLPETLDGDIRRFATLAGEYQRQEVSAVEFKAFRVPMGVYEQRVDGVYMTRVRTAGGVITPKQFAALIDIALRRRSDMLHITTRQEIQLQNLSLDSVEAVMRDLLIIGLCSKGGGGNTVRNILVSEDSGISARESFDATPYAAALTSKLIAEPDSCLLPRKLKIAFSSDENRTGYAAVNDLGFVARVKDGERGFRVFVGGGGGSKPSVGWLLFDFIPEGDLFAAAAAVKKFFSEHGNRKNRNKARLRFIFYKLGEDETLRLIRAYFREAREKTPAFVFRPDAAGRPADACRTADGETPPDGDDYRLWAKRYVATQRQAGFASILVPVLHGDILLRDAKRVEALRQILAFADRFGDDTVRFVTSQSIRLRNIPDAALPELYRLLKAFVPGLHEPAVINSIVSCTGADTCRLGIGLSKGLADAVRRELAGFFSAAGRTDDLDRLGDVRIHISGCPNSCGQHHWADIGFAGRILRNDRPYPGYQVYLGARRDVLPGLAEPAGSISARDVPVFVRRLFDAFLHSGAPSFAAFLERDGKNAALALIEEYGEIPAFVDDRNYYFDWGAETLFSVAGRGTAECSAGLFDMIEVDLSAIRDSRRALSETVDAAERSRLLYGVVYASARMLLVTRGAEPKTTEELFDMFIKNFILAGLVDGRFLDIVTVARDARTYDFNSRRAEIEDLADRVIALYESMDDSLQFRNLPPAPAFCHVPATATAPATAGAAATVQKFKDLRGVSCPMNFVQTKILLSSMQAGELLEIRLDDGQPADSVPASVRGEGHTIVEQSQHGDYWTVVIRKRAQGAGQW